MVEVSKQHRPTVQGGLGAVVRRPLRVLEGMGQGAPEPALREGGDPLTLPASQEN